MIRKAESREKSYNRAETVQSSAAPDEQIQDELDLQGSVELCNTSELAKSTLNCWHTRHTECRPSDELPDAKPRTTYNKTLLLEDRSTNTCPHPFL